MLAAGLFLFSTFYFFTIRFLARGLSRLSSGKNSKKHFFSIIIAARDEGRLISRCLRSVFSQDYPGDKFEVIVVDDRSTDGTGKEVEALQQANASLKLIRVETCPPGVSPKKNALSKGIQAAGGEIILFTDADSIVPPTWVSAINRHFEKSVGCVSGLTTYHKTEKIGPLLFGLQAMDFFSHSVVSAAAIGANLPLNTNANNLAVRRKLYDEAKGFQRVKEIVSGDDDLLVHALAAAGAGLRFAPEPEGAVTTEPTKTAKGVWEQRKRWASKTVFYNKKQVLLLGGVFLFYLLIFLGFYLPPYGTFGWNIAGGAFCFKMGMDFWLAYRGMLRFGKKELLLFFLPMSLLHVPLIVLACFFGVFGKFTWKQETFSKTLSS